MEQEFNKNLIYGNFRSMPNEAFPIDCETLSALQNNTQKIAAIAKLAGGNLILSGCKPNGTRRTEGYVYVDNGLTGEILYHPDQLRDDIYCHIDDKTTVSVRADGIDFVDAYTIRYLKEGAAGTPIRWETFLDLSKVSNAALKNALTALQQSLQTEITARQNAVTAEKTARENADANEKAARENADANEKAARENADANEKTARLNADATLQNQINALKTNTSLVFVKGMIIMWSGAANQIPSGWTLCNGQNGTPPLQDRFIVAAGSKYSQGTSGGREKHSHSGSFTLKASDIPAHRHRFSGDDRMSNGQYTTRYGSGRNQAGSDGSAEGWDHLTDYYIYDSNGNYATMLSSRTKYYTTDETSSLPPYYALCFIMKL